MNLAALLELIVRLATLTTDELAQMTAGIAEVLGGATVEEANQVRGALRSAYAEVRAGDDAAQHVDALRTAVEADGAVGARLDVLAAEDERVATELAALDAQMTDTEPETPAEDEPGTGDEPAPAEPETPAEEVEETPAETEDRQPVAAGATPAARPRPRAVPAPVGAAQSHVPAGHQARPGRGRSTNQVIGLLGDQMGNELPGGLADAAVHILARHRAVARVRGGVAENVPVARIVGEYGEDRQLGMDPGLNAERMRAVGAGSPDALVAAGGICVPAEPYYGMAQISTDDRPVRSALANFQAARGGITFIPPNDIGDYASGVDEWTVADDLAVTSSTATWKPVLSIACGTPTTVTLRAVTRIMETGNWYDRTHPEAVRADLGNLMAAHARKAETLLLRDIKAGSTKTTAQSYGSNTPVGVTRDTLVYVGALAENIRNRHRLPAEARLDWLAPAFLRRAIQADIALQQPGDDALAVALAEINGYLEARGVQPFWYLDDPGDGPSQYFTAPAAASPHAATPTFPVQAQWAMFHDGAWLFLDGGELDLGVSRDFDQNRQNKFGIFAETFEAAAMVGLESQWVTQIVSVAGGFGTGEDLGS